MSWVVWITGLPGSGKSTVAVALKELIGDAVILQMDAFRKIVTPEPEYSERERELVYRALVYTAKTLYSLGHNVIIDATGNRAAWRNLAREVIPEFYEAYLDCPLKTCIDREKNRTDTHHAPSGIYAKSRAGQPVPGVNVPYEKSEYPEIIIDSENTLPQEAAAKISEIIKKHS